LLLGASLTKIKVGVLVPAEEEPFLPGEYSLCYCSAEQDAIRGDLDEKGEVNSTYVVSENEVCVVPEGNGTYSDYITALLPAYLDHRCVDKCMTGCDGPSCYCELAPPHRDALSEARLCLPVNECAAACTSHEGCIGFDTINGACFLVASCPKRVEVRGAQSYSRRFGTACTALDDFAVSVGSIVLSDRVAPDAHYVVGPGEDAMLELQVLRGGYKNDRIAIMDGFATCGLSSPSKDVAFSGWAELEPQDFPDEFAPQKLPNVSLFKYVTRDEQFCYGENLVPAEIGLAEHQCYNKCSKGSSDRNCEGYLSGYDTPTSNALCLSEYECRVMCTLSRDCEVIDMHKSKPRCFFNPVACAEKDEQWEDTTYKTLKIDRDTSAFDGMIVRSPGVHPDPLDGTTAWLEKSSLPFGPLPLSPGTFKVCFCDAERAAPCASWSDYSIDAGTLHVSGVACLLSVPTLRVAECASTPLGSGLYCVP